MMSRESLLLLLFCSIFIDFDDDLKLVKLVPGKEEDLIDVISDITFLDEEWAIELQETYEVDINN